MRTKGVQALELKDKIRSLFYDRAPNALVFEHISYVFPDVPKVDLDKILADLVADGFLKSTIYTNKHYPKFHRTGYEISSDELGEYPVETEIQIGSFKIPRMLDGDTARAEDMNTIALSFKKVVTPRIEEVKRMIER